MLKYKIPQIVTLTRKLWVITKPGLEKVWALRIKKGCVSILTQPHFCLCRNEATCNLIFFFFFYFADVCVNCMFISVL